jgi:hypothetical protein
MAIDRSLDTTLNDTGVKVTDICTSRNENRSQLTKKQHLMSQLAIRGPTPQARKQA